MTLTLAWIRTVGSSEELVVASDSRLTGNGTFDGCPKLMGLPRGDCFLGFAGDIGLALPFMQHVSNAMSLHRASLNRSLDLEAARGHILRIIQSIESSWIDRPEDGRADVELLFGGYSWRTEEFALWKFVFDPTAQKFIHKRIRPWRRVADKWIAVAAHPRVTNGDIRRMRKAGQSAVRPEFDLETEAKRRLVRVLKESGRWNDAGLDMEPFEVLRDMLRERLPHIGGPPQVLKLYKSLTVQPIATYWPDRKSGMVNLLGRQLLHYEELDVPVMDPDDPRTPSALRDQVRRTMSEPSTTTVPKVV